MESIPKDVDRFSQEIVWSRRKLSRRLQYSREEKIRAEKCLACESEEEKSNFRTILQGRNSKCGKYLETEWKRGKFKGIIKGDL